MQSIGAAEAVSLAIVHNPGQVATPTQDTSKLALIFPTLEGWQAESTPPGFNSIAEWDWNSESSDRKPTTITIKPTPGIRICIFTKIKSIRHFQTPNLSTKFRLNPSTTF